MKAAEPVIRTHLLACLVIGIITAATWWPRISGPIDLRWDGGAYYILGTSLVEGKGYRLLSEPGDIRSSLHPPFLPAFVAAHQLVLNSSDPAVVGQGLRVSIALFSIAYAITIYLLLSVYVPRAYASAAAVIAVFQPQYIYFSDSLYAETFFGLFHCLFPPSEAQQEHRLFSSVWGMCGPRLRGAHGGNCFARSVGRGQSAAERFQAHANCARNFDSSDSELDWVDCSGGVLARYQQPAYAYQTAPYLYFNVSYARNMLTLVDPSHPELGPLTARALLRRVWANVQVLPSSIGQAVSSWAAPPTSHFL